MVRISLSLKVVSRSTSLPSVLGLPDRATTLDSSVALQPTAAVLLGESNNRRQTGQSSRCAEGDIAK